MYRFKKIINNTNIMSSIINTIICPTVEGKRQIKIRDIDMSNQKDIIEEIERLKEFLLKYNKLADPKPRPTHIDFDDYGSERRKEYNEAKTQYYKNYMDTCVELENNIKNLQGINTQLCIDEKKEEDAIKIKEGTFYNADEEIYRKEQEQHLKALKKRQNEKYYDKNKKVLKKRRIIKKSKTAEQKHVDIDPKMIRNNKLIKPLCVCGGGKGFGALCNISNVKTIEEHSNKDRHLLFKSVIKYIHYKRKGNKKLKSVIDRINKEMERYKSIVREKEEGEKSYTKVYMTDKEIIKLHQSIMRPIDENITHQPRISYITKVEYTDDYQDEIRYIRNFINPNTK